MSDKKLRFFNDDVEWAKEVLDAAGVPYEEVRLTDQQREALRNLCERYHVEFDEADYSEQWDLPEGWVAGWIGGPEHGIPNEHFNPSKDAWIGKTIYVGCDPEGNISS